MCKRGVLSSAGSRCQSTRLDDFRAQFATSANWGVEVSANGVFGVSEGGFLVSAKGGF